MRKIINNKNNSKNQYQFDLFESEQQGSIDIVNKSSSLESNLQESGAEDCEKSFNYSMGNHDNSFLLTYIDYDCPQALNAHETITESLKRLFKK